MTTRASSEAAQGTDGAPAWRLALLLAALAVAAAGALLWHIDWVEVSYDAGPSSEARRDPFLAASRYLTEQGYRVTRHASLRDFDDPEWVNATSPEDVVVLVDTYGLISQQRIDHLLAWVEGGGSLLVSARPPYEGAAYSGATSALNDPLFAYFGLRLSEADGDLVNDSDWRQIAEFSRLVGIGPEQVCHLLDAQATLVFDGEEETLELHFLRPEYFLLDESVEASAVVGDEQPRMVQFEVGDGLVTFLASLEAWKNPAIGCLDHAWVLQNFAPPVDGDGTLRFYYDLDRESLLATAWQRFPAALLLGAVLIGVWIWCRAVRFGPARDPAPAILATRLSASRASGEFLWEHVGGAGLAAVLRAELVERLRREGFACDADGRFSAAQIGARLEVPVALVTTALDDPPPVTPAAFTTFINACQTIRTRL